MKSGLCKSNKNIIVPASSLKTGDVAAILIISAIAVGLILFLWSVGVGEHGERYAEISVTDGENASLDIYPLNQDNIINFESLGYHFTAEISDGKISVTETDCRDGICRNTPPISSEKEAIICAPAKMIIKIISYSNSSSSDEEDYDYVAH